MRTFTWRSAIATTLKWAFKTAEQLFSWNYREDIPTPELMYQTIFVNFLWIVRIMAYSQLLSALPNLSVILWRICRSGIFRIYRTRKCSLYSTKILQARTTMSSVLSTMFCILRNKDAWRWTYEKANRFARCALCVELDIALKRTVDTQPDTTSIEKRKMEHTSMVFRERQEYRKKGDCRSLYREFGRSITIHGVD